jgi:hypothetical protein
VNDVHDQELPDERSVWSAEAAALGVGVAVLLLAFGGYTALIALLPDGAEWVARAASTFPGLWLAIRAYRRVLRGRGFESNGLGVPLR